MRASQTDIPCERKQVILAYTFYIKKPAIPAYRILKYYERLLETSCVFSLDFDWLFCNYVQFLAKKYTQTN